MDYEQWDKLSDEMAIEAFCAEAIEGMMPYAEAKEYVLRLKCKSESNIETGSLGVQEWRALERHMGNALTALETLGYTVEKKE